MNILPSIENRYKKKTVLFSLSFSHSYSRLRVTKEKGKKKENIYLKSVDSYGEKKKATTRKGSLERVRALTHLSTFLLLWSICNTTMAGQPNLSPLTSYQRWNIIFSQLANVTCINNCVNIVQSVDEAVGFFQNTFSKGRTWTDVEKE